MKLRHRRVRFSSQDLRRTVLLIAAAASISLPIVFSCRTSGPASPLSPFAEFLSVSAGFRSTVAIVPSGEVRCWGDNSEGQFGNGMKNTGAPNLDGDYAAGISNAIAVASGSTHACAILSDGRVRCWGLNDNGQVGNSKLSGWYLTPAEVPDLIGAVRISATTNRTCVVMSDGTIKCWGSNDGGALGAGSAPPLGSSTPLTVFGISSAVDVSLGARHGCALLSDGSVWCWGANGNGQLGNGTTIDSPVPVVVPGINAKGIAAGSLFTCALLVDGTVKCWGAGYDGQLGNGLTGAGSSSLSPTPVIGLSGVIAIDAGSLHACALLQDGSVQCWGNDEFEQVGNGDDFLDYIPTPVSVVGIDSASKISIGGIHSCVILKDRKLKCWGGNESGELTDGTIKTASVPVP